jgi:hypothetical protein
MNMKQMETNRGWNYLVQNLKIRILPFNFKGKEENTIDSSILNDYLEQMVLLLNEILDETKPFEEKFNLKGFAKFIRDFKHL